MKIGVISMQRIYNYGSFMQSYALKTTLEKMGHICVFIDIKPGRQLEQVKNSRSKKLIEMLKKIDFHIFKRISHYFQMKKFNKIFKEVLKEELGVDQFNCSEHCDAVIIGSDEVFNCTQIGKEFGYSTHLFGRDVNADKVLSFAASFGHTNIEDLVKYHIDEEIANCLCELSAISVRDKNSADIVEALTGIIPNINADPVIIAEFDNRIIKPEMTNYIAIYAYDNRIKDKREIQAIKAFAKKSQKKLVGVGMYQIWCDVNVIGTPFEIVGYIKYADYVITDTFHGCVFSIKYEKIFAAFIRSTNKNKLIDLLERFQVKDRLIDDPSKLEKILMAPLDVVNTQFCVKAAKAEAEKYLMNVLT